VKKLCGLRHNLHVDIDSRQRSITLLTKSSALVSYQLFQASPLFIQRGKTPIVVFRENMLVWQCSARWKYNWKLCNSFVLKTLGIVP